MTKAANTAVSEAPTAGANGGGSVSGAGRAARATAMMIAFVLLSRVLGVVRDIVLAYFFGQNSLTDAYNGAFRIPDMLYLLVAGGALSSVFVPVFTQYVNDRREDDAWKTFGSFVSIVAIAAAALVLVMETVAYPVTGLLFPLFPSHVVAQTAALSRILLPAQWCFFVGGLMMGVLQARGRFLVPALGPVIYNVSIVAGGVLGGWLFASRPQVGISLMTWGALLGAFLGNFLLPIWDLRRSGARWPLRIDLRHPGVAQVGRLLLPALLGLSLSQIGFWITQSFLPADGRISALKYAYNLTQAPIGIFAQASAIVLFPAISLLAAQKDWPAFRNEVSHGIRRILFLTVPASLLMTVLAEPIIRLLYAGPRFGEAEIAQAASALRIYSVGTFAWSAQAVLGRGFFAMQDTKTPLSITKAMIVLFTLSCFVLNHLLGFEGLALAMSLVATVNMGIFLVLLARRIGGLDIRGGMAGSAARIFAAAALSRGRLGRAAGARAGLSGAKPGAALLLAAAGGPPSPFMSARASCCACPNSPASARCSVATPRQGKVVPDGDPEIASSRGVRPGRCAARSAPPTPAPPHPNRASVRRKALGCALLLDVPARLAALGFCAMEIRHFHLPSREAAYLGAGPARRFSRRKGRDVVALIDDGDITHPEHGARDRAWIGGRIDTAALLGASLRARDRGEVRADRGGDGAAARRAGRDRRLRPREECAALTENWLALLPSPGQVHRLLDSLGGAVGLCLDFGNWGGGARYDDLAAIAPRATSCHAKAGFTGPGALDQEDFRRCLDLTRAAGFGGPYTLVNGGPGDEWEGLALQRDFLAPYLGSHAPAA